MFIKLLEKVLVLIKIEIKSQLIWINYKISGNKDLILSSQLISTFDLIFGFALLKVFLFNHLIIKISIYFVWFKEFLT
jgi:hypothetical protein